MNQTNEPTSSEVAHVLLEDEDGDWSLYTLGVDEDGDLRVRHDHSGTMEEVYAQTLRGLPIVIGRALH